MEPQAIIVDYLVEKTGLPSEQIAKMLAQPKDASMGDVAFPCFSLAKELKKAPPQIASDLASEFEAKPPVTEANAVSGFLNFRIDPSYLAQTTLEAVQSQGEQYGNGKDSKKTVCVEYSSPNIAKPFGIGHLSPTIIGHAIANIQEAQGNKVIRLNHLGDWGTQFGKLIVAFEKWGKEEELENEPILHLFDIYVKFHKEAEEHPELEDQGREAFMKLEQGEQKYVDLWQRFRDLSIREFNRIYDMLDIKFHSLNGEAFYQDKMENVISTAKEKGIASESEGALIVDLEEHKMPPCLLVKKDGSTLYATRDIAAAMYRKQEYQFDQLLYVVGAPQQLHFKQFFKVIELMGEEWISDVEHLSFGHIRLPEGKMSTRKGNIIFLEDVLNKSIELVRSIIEEKNPKLENKDEVARQVGIGAIIFWNLSSDRTKDITFDWDSILDFNGETGPYVQYAHARVCSLLRKYGKDVPKSVDFSTLTHDAEKELVRQLQAFPGHMAQSAKQNKPHIISRALLDVCQAFSNFYQHCHVLNEEDTAIQEARILLSDSARIVMKKGITLLGMKAPEEM